MHPSCNTIHEVASSRQLSFVNEGSVSVIFEIAKWTLQNDKNDMHDNTNTNTNTANNTSVSVDDDDPTRPPNHLSVILKTNMMDSPVDARQIDFRTKDANVASHHMPSPYITPVHGHCGIAALFPYATRGTLYDYVESVRVGGTTFSNLDTLKVALQLANAVADLHEIHHEDDDDDVPTFVHNDLGVDQFIYQNGIYQLNDFNSGTYGYRNTTNTTTTASNNDNNKNNNVKTASTCFDDPGMSPFLNRAPEDLRHSLLTTNNTTTHYVQHYAEIFSLGTALYVLLTHRWMWNHKHQQQRGFQALMRGERPPLPKKYRQSDDPAVHAIVAAIVQCWQQEPSQRPSAQQVARFLESQLKKLIKINVTTNHDQQQQPLTLDDIRVTLPILYEGEDDYDQFM
jgi:Protein tyrosine and serine/threonine kinase